MHVVLVPGLMCDEGAWAKQVMALGPIADISVASHELADSIGGMAERVIAVAPARFAVAGHSMGGRVALEIARRAPDRVSGLALLDTSCQPLQPGLAGESERTKRLGLLDQARREGMRTMGRQWLLGMIHPDRLHDRPLVESILAMLERSSVLQYAAQVKALLERPDSTQVLPGVRVPTLCLCGREDGWTSAQSHREMAASTARGVFVEAADCGHMSPMERPEAVTAAMEHWIAQIGD